MPRAQACAVRRRVLVRAAIVLMSRPWDSASGRVPSVDPALFTLGTTLTGQDRGEGANGRSRSSRRLRNRLPLRPFPCPCHAERCAPPFSTVGCGEAGRRRLRGGVVGGRQITLASDSPSSWLRWRASQSSAAGPGHHMVSLRLGVRSHMCANGRPLLAALLGLFRAGPSSGT